MVESMSKDVESFTVLLVDTDSRALELAARHIEHWIPGVTVLRANRCSEARSLAGVRNADVIVLDCDRQEDAWNELLTNLTAACPSAKAVLTARSSIAVSQCPNVLGCLRKPYRVDDLIALVMTVRTTEAGA